MRAGWFKEPWRHGLAARGVKTKYYATKGRRYYQEQAAVEAGTKTTSITQDQPIRSGFNDMLRRIAERDRPVAERMPSGGRTQTFTTQEKEARAEARLQEFRRQQAVGQQPVERALADIKAGRLNVVDLDGRQVSVASFSSNPSLTPQDRARLKAAVNEQAISLTQAQIPVPAEYQGVLTDVTKAQIKALQTQQKIEGRSPGQQVLAQTGRGLAIGAEEAVIGAGERVAAAPGQVVGAAREGLDEAGQPRGLGLFGGAQPSPRGKAEASGPSLFSDNPFLGGPNIATSGGNVALGTGPGGQKVDQYPEAKVANREVDELYGAKSRLKDVDLSGFQKGKASFKKGDREGLIRSINALEAEEQKLRDRWTMVEQTRSVLLNPRTRAATLRQEEGSFSLFGGSRGGSAVADQTQKLNDVKREIKESANEAYARRVVLQGDLQRLDAQVKPVTDAPRDVAVFKDDVGASGGAASLRGSLDWYKGLGK